MVSILYLQNLASLSVEISAMILSSPFIHIEFYNADGNPAAPTGLSPDGTQWHPAAPTPMSPNGTQWHPAAPDATAAVKHPPSKPACISYPPTALLAASE